ncbi:hypothetical protein TNCV_2778971 [Trichonephila clavipes]|nr:hypothetical protein TNCV_2778971 [Trichonephila clavipes]
MVEYVQHVGTLNISRATKPLEWTKERGRSPSDHPPGILSQYWGGQESKHIVTCLVFKAVANDKRKSSLSPRSI